MKLFITSLLFLLQASILLGQVDEVEKCGLDDQPRINIYEAKYFNEVFEKERGAFDFNGKAIAFYNSSAGTNKSTKSNYFRGLKRTLNTDDNIHAWQANGTQLLILTNEEKDLSGGYDAILVSWSKLLKQGKSKTKLVKRLKGTLPNKG